MMGHHDPESTFGLDTIRVREKIRPYCKVYSRDRICWKCHRPKEYLTNRNGIQFYDNGGVCESCHEEMERESRELRDKDMRVALEELKYHCLSSLELNIFNALIKNPDIDAVAKRFGMSEKRFTDFLRKLTHLNIIFFNRFTGELRILEEYKNIFREYDEEKKVKKIFTPNNLKLYKYLKSFNPYVFPEVPVCTFVDLEVANPILIDAWHKDYFLRCRVDALVCREDGTPVYAAEFQGSYHEEEEQKIRDDLKKKIIEEAGVPLNYFTYKDLEK